MFNKIDYIIDYETNKITLTDDGIKKAKENIRKITGSNFYDILELEHFIKTSEGEFKFGYPISSVLSRVGLRIPIFDKMFVNAGNEYEDIIHKGLVKSLESSQIEFDIKQIKAEEVDYDYFKDVNHFGGIPDALLKYKNNNIVIDYKTARRSKWNDQQLGKGGYGPNTKLSYHYQLALYKKLLNYDDMWIVHILLDPQDYFVESMSMVKEVVVSRVVDDIFPNNKHSSIEDAMGKAKSFVYDFANGWVSLPFDPRMNMNDLKWLAAHNQEERDEIERRIVLMSSYEDSITKTDKLK